MAGRFSLVLRKKSPRPVAAGIFLSSETDDYFMKVPSIICCR